MGYIKLVFVLCILLLILQESQNQKTGYKHRTRRHNNGLTKVDQNIKPKGEARQINKLVPFKSKEIPIVSPIKQGRLARVLTNPKNKVHNITFVPMRVMQKPTKVVNPKVLPITHPIPTPSNTANELVEKRSREDVVCENKVPTNITKDNENTNIEKPLKENVIKENKGSLANKDEYNENIHEIENVAESTEDVVESKEENHDDGKIKDKTIISRHDIDAEKRVADDNLKIIEHNETIQNIIPTSKPSLVTILKSKIKPKDKNGEMLTDLFETENTIDSEQVLTVTKELVKEIVKDNKPLTTIVKTNTQIPYSYLRQEEPIDVCLKPNYFQDGVTYTTSYNTKEYPIKTQDQVTEESNDDLKDTTDTVWRKWSKYEIVYKNTHLKPSIETSSVVNKKTYPSVNQNIYQHSNSGYNPFIPHCVYYPPYIYPSVGYRYSNQ